MERSRASGLFLVPLATPSCTAGCRELGGEPVRSAAEITFTQEAALGIA